MLSPRHLSRDALRRAAPLARSGRPQHLRRRLSLQPLCLAGQRAVAAAPRRLHATAPPAAVSSSSPSLSSSASVRPANGGALPSPAEVHHVIARSVQRGRWMHAVRLLLGALHSRCVPLAETYQLVLLAALRGGGWQAAVELTRQVATSPLSATALYHTAADLILTQAGGGEGRGHSDERTRAVVEELVPLMLADATRHVVWRPRHRLSVLQALREADALDRVPALFQRWSAAAAAGGSGGAVAAEEAALLMAAFADRGDWRSAEDLRRRLPAMPAELLARYIDAFTAALQGRGHGAAPTTGQPPQHPLVPWETAVDAAAAQPASAAVAAAMAQLQRVARQSLPPRDVAQWWWSAAATVHARLTELRRCAAQSPREAVDMLARCHATQAEVAELLRAVESAGVLSGAAVAPATVSWLRVVLALAAYCPAALVSEGGVADGLQRLLPPPSAQLPPAALAGTPVPEPATTVWRCVLDAALQPLPRSGEEAGSAAGQLLRLTAALHYLVATQQQAALPELQRAVAEACAAWRQHQQHATASRAPIQVTDRAGDVAVHLRTIGSLARLPSWELCEQAVGADGAAAVALLDETALTCMRPLEGLGSASQICEVLCAVLEAAPTVAAGEAYVLLVYASQPLRDGTPLAALRPALQRVEAVLRRVPPAEGDGLLLLCAQLQWCLGGSVESLSATALPVLVRHQSWAALSRLLALCPLPLSRSQRRAAADCAQGRAVEELRRRVEAGEAEAAWQQWGTVRSGAGADAVPLSLELVDALATLLHSSGRRAEMSAVLAGAGAACVAADGRLSRARLGLRAFHHATQQAGGGVTLADLWMAAKVEGSDVAKRESAATLALYAAFAMSSRQRDGEALRLLCEAAAFVASYDAAHRHHRAADTVVGEDMECEWRFALAAPLPVTNTDEQTAAETPAYVQCAMASIVVGGLTGDATAETMRTARFVFALTTQTPSLVAAWAAALPRALESLTAEKESDTAGGQAVWMLVLSLAYDVLALAVERRLLLPAALLRPLVDDLTSGTAASSRAEAAMESARGALAALQAAGGDTAEVRRMAAQVAHFLAAQDRPRHALEWVDAFDLWRRAGEAPLVAEDALWRWLQSSAAAEQRRADTQAALRQRGQVASGPGEAEAEGVLAALLECGAWQEAFGHYIGVVAGPDALRSLAEFSEASMARVELRDRYLSPAVLVDVMSTVARHAPWRATVQAWMLLRTHLSFFVFNVPVAELAAAWRALLTTMRRQGADPCDVGTVLVWLVAHFSPPLGVVAALLCDYADHIEAAAGEWTRAAAATCADHVARLRGLLTEQRVWEAAQAIAHAEAALAISCAGATDSTAGGGETLSWLPPCRPPLSPAEVAALVAVAPLLLLAAAPQLESLARHHLGGRFDGATLKALLWLYRAELQARVAADDAAAAAESAKTGSAVTVAEAAVVAYLSHNTTLHVRASQAFRFGVAADDAAAASWLALEVFDGLLSQRVAAALWSACRAAAARLAQCRWSPVAEAELQAALLANFGKPPTRLSTAPLLRPAAIAHYWSCFHHVLLPELHLSPLELCCLAAYAPTVGQLRTRASGTTDPAYRAALRALAAAAHRSHFSAGRVPAEDSLAHLRTPHTPAALAAVLSTAHKKLTALHRQVYDDAKTAVPAGLRAHFAATAVADAAEAEEGVPPRWERAALAAAVRQLCGLPPQPAAATAGHCGGQPPSPLLLRSWLRWVDTECVAQQRPVPPAASLLLVEWVRRAVQRGAAGDGGSPADSRALDGVGGRWQSVVLAAAVEEQQRRCRELARAWQLPEMARAWSLLNAGHRAALERMMSPSHDQVKALPAKSRRNDSRAAPTE